MSTVDSEKTLRHAAEDERSLARFVEQKVNAMPIVKHLGLRLCVGQADEALVRIDAVEDFHLGGQERPVLNGTVLMGLLDCAMASAAIMRLRGGRCATIEFSAKLMKPAFAGGIYATGKVLSAKGGLLFCEGRVYDRRDQLVVIATSVFKRLDTVQDP
ncbi:MAG: PaaI family thioesterase [Sulfurifustis sp.]